MLIEAVDEAPPPLCVVETRCLHWPEHQNVNKTQSIKYNRNGFPCHPKHSHCSDIVSTIYHRHSRPSIYFIASPAAIPAASPHTTACKPGEEINTVQTARQTDTNLISIAMGALFPHLPSCLDPVYAVKPRWVILCLFLNAETSEIHGKAERGCGPRLQQAI